MHLRRKYSLLEPEELEGGQSNPGSRVSGYGQGATRWTAEEGQTEIETIVETGQQLLLACGMQEDRNEERSSPDQSCALNACDHPGGGRRGGDPSPASACLLRASRGWRETPQHGSVHH